MSRFWWAILIAGLVVIVVGMLGLLLTDWTGWRYVVVGASVLLFAVGFLAPAKRTP